MTLIIGNARLMSLTLRHGYAMSDLIAYKSNALTDARYKLSLQEQRFLLVCISRIDPRVGASPPERQKTMTVTAAEFHEAFPDMGRQNAEAQLKEATDRLWDRTGGLDTH